MKQLLVTLSLILLCLLCVNAQNRCWGSPEPFRLVYDEAEMLGYADEARVQVGIEQFNGAFGVTLVLYLAPDLCGWSALGFATVLGSDWGVGDAELNNGMVLLISPKREGQAGGIALSVGKGIEDLITDEEAQEVIDVMIPRLKENDWYGAIVEALRSELPKAIQE